MIIETSLNDLSSEKNLFTSLNLNNIKNPKTVSGKLFVNVYCSIVNL